jgi:hypothetical protein
MPPEKLQTEPEALFESDIPSIQATKRQVGKETIFRLLTINAWKEFFSFGIGLIFVQRSKAWKAFVPC